MRTVTRNDQGTEAPIGLVVALDHPVALLTAVTGAKAAALAKAARTGLPVLPGRVVTTAASGLRSPSPALDEELRTAWSAMSEQATRPVVVRSSSVLEDGRASSMAGMFTSVLDVRDWDTFRQAVDTVVASATLVGSLEADRPTPSAPMAVLVQPQLDAAVGGVMFGVDPVSGRRHRLVISASESGPAAVVGGEVDGSRYVVSRLRRVEGPEGHGPLTHNQIRHLARLARHAERVFGGPQDIEWAIDTEGRLWLLQSRPVTATSGIDNLRGPWLGPGPVAETFPDPLSPLEEDLWVAPLRDGLRAAMGIAGSSSRHRLAESTVVTAVGGRVAADLDLLTYGGAPRSTLRRLDPRPSVRRLVAAWRVGRLRAALPDLAAHLVSKADDDLLAVPKLEDLSDEQLLVLLRRSQQGLVALHGHEVLLGWLVSPGTTATTAASLALRTLAAARRSGETDAEIVARYPGVLALTAPRIGSGSVELPPTIVDVSAGPTRSASLFDANEDRAALMREALRLRARWVHELTARAAWELGGRLHARDVLPHRELVRLLRLHELESAARTGSVPPEVTARRPLPPMAPLPARFRLAADGSVVAIASPSLTRRSGGGTGAGGGRGMGAVHSGTEPPARGAVMVVRTLDPGLASMLPRLAGLVAETGSVLSHLAILARELHIPTVVGVADAVARFPAGATVLVDGATGEVQLVDVGVDVGVAMSDIESGVA